MKANPTYLLDSLSNNDITFFIPPYQRNYEWSTDMCKVFFADVKDVAEANASSSKAEHFFGSIVYVIEESGFGIPNRYILTDGQQRITTTMLFLMALRDSISDSNYQEAIQSRYLENPRAGGGAEYKIKLKQVETDWEAYKLLALGHSIPPDLKNSTVYQNYIHFKKALASFDDQGKKNLLQEGLRKFSIISIQLEPDRNPWENPQEIFESMNSLGKPLSLADLVRNYLLMGKSSERQTQLYNEYWLALEKRLPGVLSEFIRNWMQADQHRSYKVARENNFKELYGSFKDIVGSRGVEEIFEDFVRFSHPYAIASGLQKTGLRSLDQVISDLNIIGVAPAYSYLTEILAAWEVEEFSDSDVTSILIAMRTYLLRRRVLGIAAAENKFFPVLGSRLDELMVSNNPTETVFRQLSSQEYSLRLPNDAEVRSGLQGMNFYNLGRSRNYPKLLLSMAEQTLTKSRPRWEDPMLQLEHIMPQKLSAGWRATLGESAEKDHQEFVNNIGNITLIRHNQELGNRPFSEKKKIYSDRSGLQIAQNYVTDCQNWDMPTILRRRDYLISLLLDCILVVPDRFKAASNWKQDSASSPQFDSKHVLNRLIGETIYYVENPKLSAQVVSDSKVSFEEEEWSLSPLTRHLKERAGVGNKSTSYQGALYWSWDDTKLVDVELL